MEPGPKGLYVYIYIYIYIHIYTDIRRYDERDLRVINVSVIRIHGHIYLCVESEHVIIYVNVSDID